VEVSVKVGVGMGVGVVVVIGDDLYTYCTRIPVEFNVASLLGHDMHR